MTFRKPFLRPLFVVSTAAVALLLVFALLITIIHPLQANAAGIPTQASTGRVVKIVTTSQGSFAFSPMTLKITLGTTVTWKNTTQVSHTVTSDDGKTFNSGIIAPGGTFKFTFKKKGTFGYHCQIHPFMTATVIVS